MDELETNDENLEETGVLDLDDEDTDDEALPIESDDVEEDDDAV
jgi:hypothetical protein